jgi:ABC-type Fe3+-siderophore transport system permease subunit
MITRAAQGFTGMESREGRMYEEVRTKRVHRRLLVGYALSIALWLMCTIPLARLSSDEGGGVAVAAIYLAAGLAVALVIRGVYTLTTPRPFRSPWVFVIAAILAITSYGIQSAGDAPFRPEGANEGAEAQQA